MYGDGWAAPRVKFALPPDWQSEVSLVLRGRCSAHAYPLPLQVSMGNHVRHRTVIEGREFALRVQLGPSAAASQPMHAAEVKLSAEKSFIPHAINAQGDTRTLAYRLTKLSLVNAWGRELTLYSARTYWLFTMMLPVICLAKSVLINHRQSVRELWRTARHVWGDLMTIPCRWLSRQD